MHATRRPVSYTHLNMTVEEARGNVRGREYHGLVYSVTDDKGNKVGNPFKSDVYKRQGKCCPDSPPSDFLTLDTLRTQTGQGLSLIHI